MKNLRPLILGIIIGALATYFFCPRQAGKEENVVTAEILKPKGVITVEQALELNDNWTKYRKPAVDSCITAQTQGKIKVDDRSVGWSVKDIKDYLIYAETEADKFGYSMDSIRVYLGVYGANAPHKANYTTMFIAPKGQKLTAEASSIPFVLPTQFPGTPPLNDGSGGDDDYSGND
ncbi:hypothetical protein N1F78_13830 [Seonamhaeicola sp. MEBiC1930]|uniref:hypothetical protein n=1 Tax=Seonamhaeicola sp. MEBiC01930 TaxID=2976768 RepID=UPI003251D90D